MSLNFNINGFLCKKHYYGDNLKVIFYFYHSSVYSLGFYTARRSSPYNPTYLCIDYLFISMWIHNFYL